MNEQPWKKLRQKIKTATLQFTFRPHKQRIFASRQVHFLITPSEWVDIILSSEQMARTNCYARV